MAYAVEGAESAPPLILLHGLGDSKRSWSLMTSDLAKTHRVYALDQRGHGQSSAPACCYTTTDLAYDVVAFMDAMKIEKAAVAGHSLGSFVAQTLAIHQPERLSKLILIGSTDTLVTNALVDWLWGEVSKFGERAPAEFIDTWQANVLPVDETFHALVKRETADVAPHVWKSIARGLLTQDQRRFLKEIRVPTLILAGEKDPAFGADDQRRLRELLPHAQYEVYAGAGHNPNWEIPKVVAGDMNAFLSASETAAAPEVRLKTGVAMRYVEAGAETAPPLILLHGLGDTKRSWSPVMSDLAKTHRVYALDQRGHGGTSTPACCYTTADLADDVVAFMDAMNIDRASIAGHSLGSFVAQTLATKYPRRVTRLILIGSADTGIGNESFVWLQGEVAKFEERAPDEFVDFWQSNILPVDPAFMAQVKKETAEVAPGVWKALAPVLLSHDQRRALEEVTVPVLILAGEKDPLFPADQQQRLRALLPHAEFKEYAAAGHNTHWELPRLVADDISAFLRE